MCFIIGQFISAGVLRGFVSRTDEWGYRIPYALQWFWPIWVGPLVYFAPESPWHLARKSRFDEAERSLRRLQSADGPDPKQTLATIVYTNNLEEQLSVGTSYYDCFKGFELRRTEIACVVFGGQLVCGLCFAYASTYFFQQVGINTEDAYSLGWGANGLALLACFVNWFLLMPRFGRRTVYVWGMAAMAAELILIGILNPWTNQKPVAWTQAILTLVWTVTFQLSAGQLGWALPAEIGSTRLRQKTVCLARNVSNISGVIGGTLNNYMVNPEAFNWKGYTGFFWGGWALAVFIWAYFRLPETKDRWVIFRSYSRTTILTILKVRSMNSTFYLLSVSPLANSRPPKSMPLTSTNRTSLRRNMRLPIASQDPALCPTSHLSWQRTGEARKLRLNVVLASCPKVNSDIQALHQPSTNICQRSSTPEGCRSRNRVG